MKNLAYYQGLPYSRHAEAIHGEEGGPYWIAWVEELPGCKTDGENRIEAMANLDVAFDDYIEAMLKFGSEIQEPHRPEIRPEELVLEVSVESLEAEDTPIKEIPKEPIVADWIGQKNAEGVKSGLQIEDPDLTVGSRPPLQFV